MKTFCESLRKYARSITDFKKKKMLPLTIEELKSHENAEKCYICGIKFLKNSLEIKIIEKLEITVITQVNIEVHRIVFVI